MCHIPHSRPVASDDRLPPVEHFRDKTVCRVEWPLTLRCKQELQMAGDFSEDGCLSWCSWNLRRVEMKRSCWPKHSTQTRHTLLLSPWDVCPYIKMWFGALTGTQWGEAGWEGLGLQCKPQTHSLPPALSYTTYTAAAVCLMFVYVQCVWVEGSQKIPLSLKTKYRLK